MVEQERQIKSGLLKTIALVSMTIDHIGILFFPGVMIFRILGRLAMPIFAYQIAVGCRHTHNIGRYFLRLLVFAFLSQPIYGTIFSGDWNIFFTLLWGAVAYWLWQKQGFFRLFSIALVGASWFFPQLEYGIYGVLTIWGFGVLYEKPKGGYLFFAVLTALYTAQRQTRLPQLFSLAAIFILWYPWKKDISINKYFFYFYYPAHLCFLWLLFWYL